MNFFNVVFWSTKPLKKPYNREFNETSLFTRKVDEGKCNKHVTRVWYPTLYNDLANEVFKSIPLFLC